MMPPFSFRSWLRRLRELLAWGRAKAGRMVRRKTRAAGLSWKDSAFRKTELTLDLLDKRESFNDVSVAGLTIAASGAAVGLAAYAAFQAFRQTEFQTPAEEYSQAVAAVTEGREIHASVAAEVVPFTSEVSWHGGQAKADNDVLDPDGYFPISFQDAGDDAGEGGQSTEPTSDAGNLAYGDTGIPTDSEDLNATNPFGDLFANVLGESPEESTGPSLEIDSGSGGGGGGSGGGDTGGGSSGTGPTGSPAGASDAGNDSLAQSVALSDAAAEQSESPAESTELEDIEVAEAEDAEPELPGIGILASDSQAHEDTISTPGQFLVFRQGGDRSLDLTVTYEISGTATNGVDYEELSGSVVIAAGFATARIDIKPIDDLLSDSPESVS